MKLIIFFCSCVSLTLVTVSAAKNLYLSRIVGGQPAQPGIFPYAAAVYVTTNTSRFFCGGTLFGNQWIITAAQCVDQAVSFIVKLGSIYLNDVDNQLILSTSTYIIHPDYNPQTLDNDIGIIKFRVPIQFTDYIQPVASISTGDFPVGSQLLAFGWGLTSDDAELAEVLNWVPLTILSKEECQLTYGNQTTDKMICTVGNYNEGTCIGDTGSALVYLTRFGTALLQGIASFISGNGCESTDPSGYTRVYAYSEWVNNVTGV